jgi:hypothetical protein
MHRRCFKQLNCKFTTFSSYTSRQALALAKFGNLQPLPLMVLIETKI